MIRKKIVLVVDEKLYDWIRKTAFDRHVSMNKLIRDFIIPHSKLVDGVKNSLKGNVKR